jgi:hypothetical protein
MVYRRETANYPAFYSCPNYKQHPDQKVSIKVEDWVKQQGQPKATPANGAEPTNADLDAEIAREDARRESKGRRS